jgi:hypothetical protein
VAVEQLALKVTGDERHAFLQICSSSHHHPTIAWSTTAIEDSSGRFLMRLSKLEAQLEK